ncbi:hypothetical protein BH24ACT15_BH24ACT15_13380 [soil metagenome]
MLFATTSFVPLAKSIALASGLQDLRMIVVDHPLGGISEEGLDRRIEAAYEQLVTVLEQSLGAAAPLVTDEAADTAGEMTETTDDSAKAIVTDVDATLEELRSSLATDGAGLHVGPAGAGGIEVKLTFTDQTCMDCVIPPPILQSIIIDTLRRSGFDKPVTVVDPRLGPTEPSC